MQRSESGEFVEIVQFWPSLLLLSVAVYVDDGMFILVSLLVSKFVMVEKYFEPLKNSLEENAQELLLPLQWSGFPRSVVLGSSG